MELTNREKDLLQALSGTVKSALSMVPGLGQAIAGWEHYQKSNFERNLLNIIRQLEDKIENLNSLFSEEWLKTKDGEQFSRKVFDAAFDAQLEDKQELFLNALINGIREKDIEYIEKLKFIDMLRSLSRASLMVLAEMHKLFIEQVRGPKRKADPLRPFPLVKAERIAEELSDKFHPYLINSAVSEMEGQGLFSTVGDWKKYSGGKYRQAGGFANELCYTDFAAKFVEFITLENKPKLE